MSLQDDGSRLYINASRDRSWTSEPVPNQHEILAFHRKLPGYKPSPLIELAELAKALGVKRVLLKYEGTRLGMKAFKIMGASWAVTKAIAQHLAIAPENLSVVALAQLLNETKVKIFTASQGNHGLAIARMGQIVGYHARVFIPGDGSAQVESQLRSLGADVVRCTGKDYDEAVMLACKEAASDEAILVQDTAWEGYEEIPSWIVDGYSTILAEVDEQFTAEPIDLVVTPVGVGSLAHAVVRHYKTASEAGTRVLTVEPVTAPCLFESLRKGELRTIRTSSTIMAGMNCGTVSSTAWPTLHAGVDASALVSDSEAEESLNLLKRFGIDAGPCGAAPLAALNLRGVSGHLDLDSSSTILLICSEGPREYHVRPNSGP